jgi:hypothetical protein
MTSISIAALLAVAKVCLAYAIGRPLLTGTVIVALAISLGVAVLLWDRWRDRHY